MGRDPRFVPPRSLQHVVDSLFQGRYLLTPSAEVNDRVLGVLGRAQRTFDMPICGVVVLSNHLHLLVCPEDASHLAAFMCFVKTNLAKEVGGRIRGWRGHFFEGRYRATQISDEEAAQVAALRYVLSQGVKEHLVDRVHDWPGAHSAAASGSRGAGDADRDRNLVGTWIDRTAERRARHRTAPNNPRSYATRESVTIAPLPCWAHLEESSWRRHVDELVEHIDRQGAIERASLNRCSLGVEKILGANPLHRPESRKRSFKRRFQAVDRAVLQALIEAWSAVLAAYREASSRLRSGDQGVKFPPGTFPPALPFVPFTSKTPTMPGTGTARGRPS